MPGFVTERCLACRLIVRRVGIPDLKEQLAPGDQPDRVPPTNSPIPPSIGPAETAPSEASKSNRHAHGAASGHPAGSVISNGPVTQIGERGYIRRPGSLIKRTHETHRFSLLSSETLPARKVRGRLFARALHGSVRAGVRIVFDHRGPGIPNRLIGTPTIHQTHPWTAALNRGGEPHTTGSP